MQHNIEMLHLRIYSKLIHYIICFECCVLKCSNVATFDFLNQSHFQGTRARSLCVCKNKKKVHLWKIYIQVIAGYTFKWYSKISICEPFFCCFQIRSPRFRPFFFCVHKFRRENPNYDEIFK